MTEFDKMAQRFTNACEMAAQWKHVYYGAAYATRIKAAIKDLKAAIKVAEQHPEIGQETFALDQALEDGMGYDTLEEKAMDIG